MNKVRFGKTGLMVSRIAFGGIPIERLSVSDAVDVIRGSIALGVNFIDTANGYTDSEEKIGNAIKNMPRKNLVIASKSFARDKKTFNEHLELSLKRLGTDYIDIYQHHNISNPECFEKIMGPGGSFEGMKEAINAGKVRHPGFTGHNIPMAVEIMKTGHFSSVQLAINYVDNEAAKEAIPLAKELDIGFIAMKPFGGGRLPGAELALKYLLQFDNIIPDPGIQKLSEMEEIIQILESGKTLTAEDAVQIEKIKTELGKHWCHCCDYCQPCPQNIGIGTVLSLNSFINRLPRPRVLAFAEKQMENALSCTQCGECTSRCPYDLNVPELIKEKLDVWNAYLKSSE